MKKFTGIERSYDSVAENYAADFIDELDAKPFDRELLERFTAALPHGATLCDLGCGPGHIGDYAARSSEDTTLQVLGIDLSHRMIEIARRLYPAIDFRAGDMLALPLADESLDAIVAFYSIIHLPRTRLVEAFTEMERVLKPGGRVVVSFHGGEGEAHLDEWFGHQVDVDACMLDPDEVNRAMKAAALNTNAIETRAPYPCELQTQRCYIHASKAATNVGPKDRDNGASLYDS